MYMYMYLCIYIYIFMNSMLWTKTFIWFLGSKWKRNKQSLTFRSLHKNIIIFKTKEPGGLTQFLGQMVSPSSNVNWHFCISTRDIKILRPNFEKRALLRHNKSPEVSAHININVLNGSNMKLYQEEIVLMCLNGFHTRWGKKDFEPTIYPIKECKVKLLRNMQRFYSYAINNFCLTLWYIKFKGK